MILYKYTFRINALRNRSYSELKLLEYQVKRETKSGYWVRYLGLKNDEKWVPKEGKNLFAFRDKKDALNNFIHRKRKQIGYITYNLNRIKEAKVLAENLLDKSS
jgi:hypothetical protein